MISSELELYVTAKILAILKHFKGVSTFLLISEERRLNYKISKQCRVAITGLVGLDNQGSNSRIIMLRFIVGLLENSELCRIENLIKQSQKLLISLYQHQL